MPPLYSRHRVSLAVSCGRCPAGRREGVHPTAPVGDPVCSYQAKALVWPKTAPPEPSRVTLRSASYFQADRPRHLATAPFRDYYADDGAYAVLAERETAAEPCEHDIDNPCDVSSGDRAASEKPPFAGGFRQPNCAPASWSPLKTGHAIRDVVGCDGSRVGRHARRGPRHDPLAVAMQKCMSREREDQVSAAAAPDQVAAAGEYEVATSTPP